MIRTMWRAMVALHGTLGIELVFNFSLSTYKTLHITNMPSSSCYIVVVIIVCLCVYRVK